MKCARTLKQNNILAWPIIHDVPGWFSHHSSVLFQAFTGKDFLWNVMQGKGSWNDPKLVDAMKMWKQFWDEGFINKDYGAITWEDYQGLYLNQKAGMMPSGSFLLSRWQVDAKFDYSFFPLPSPTGAKDTGCVVIVGDSYDIAKISKRADECAMFLDFLLNDETNLKNWLRSGYLPWNKKDP